jgi:AsmA-like C-terminal region
VIYLETDDAGAFFRFTDTYSKVVGGQLQLAMDPPTVEPSAREGLINVRDFSVKGEVALDRLAASGQPGAQNSGVSFSRLRAEFTRQNGQLTIREGVLKGPLIGGTIKGSIDSANQVRMSGTFVPMYGLNNMFGQVPILGIFMGGGSNEGLIGVTYEVVGTLGQPVLNVNPISALAPGMLRKIFEFNTGKETSPVEFPPNNNN